MKLISFAKGGQSGWGAVKDDAVVDLTGKVAGARTLRELLEKGAIAEARKVAAAASPGFRLSDCTLLPVVPDPSKIICVGLNYRAHASEAGRDVGKYPVIFHRYADTLVAHGQPLIRPRVSGEFDYEGELAVVIGCAGAHIPEAEAMSYVAGYTCFNEASVRDWQFHTHQYGMGKNFKGTGGFGPWLVTADEIPDYRTLRLRTVLNEQEVQKGSLDQLIFDIPFLISYCSKALPWRPGDVLVTGTPSGVGFKRKPPLLMKAGDTVRVEIPSVGSLVNPVAAEGD